MRHARPAHAAILLAALAASAPCGSADAGSADPASEIPAASAAAPVDPYADVPTEARLRAYFIGLLADRVADVCDVPTTGPQRRALAAKLEAVRPPNLPRDALGRAGIPGGEAPCPGPDETARFSSMLDAFVALPPQRFLLSVAKAAASALPGQDAPSAAPVTEGAGAR